MAKEENFRHKRIAVKAIVRINKGVQNWTVPLQDVSATGLQTQAPVGFFAKSGETYVLDVIMKEAQFSIEARLVWADNHHVGFEFSEIPEHSQPSLWSLLGESAFDLEGFENDELD